MSTISQGLYQSLMTEALLERLKALDPRLYRSAPICITRTWQIGSQCIWHASSSELSRRSKKSTRERGHSTRARVGFGHSRKHQSGLAFRATRQLGTISLSRARDPTGWASPEYQRASDPACRYGSLDQRPRRTARWPSNRHRNSFSGPNRLYNGVHTSHGD